MRSTIVAIALSLLVGSAFAQKLTCYSQGKKVGTAVASFAVTPGGGVRMTMSLKMSSPQGTMAMRTESLSDKTGSPLTESMNMSESAAGASGKNTAMSATTKVTYSKSGATVTTTANGKSSTKNYPAPKGAKIADASVLWFLVVRPTVGTTVTNDSFDQQRLKWGKETSKYVGPRTVTIAGKQRKLHLVTSNSGQDEQKLYVDDKGNLIKAESSGLTLIAD